MLGSGFLCALLIVSGGCADGPVALQEDGPAQIAGAPDRTGTGPIDRPTLQNGEIEAPFSPRPAVQTCQLPPPPPVGTLRLTSASPHTFQRPLWYGEPPLLDPWAFVAEQGGNIWAYREDDPEQDPELFFDITVSRLGNEEGLLGLAFHPQLGSSPYLFTYYSSSGCSAPNVARCSILSRWEMAGIQAGSDELPQVKRDSERVFLEIPQPYSNHNGGDLRFGPDGYLYISLGDGGAGGDPINHAQRPETVLGAILRIDISSSDPECDTAYRIPPDNPFSSNRCGRAEGGLPEVWAWGLRNAWRMSFDRETGELWAADVGQDRWEEINRLRGGGNYGWRPVEGPECFVPGCDLAAYDPPVHSYDHSVGNSVTGGFVYRGQEHIGLRGYYVFSDFETGKVMSFSLENPSERIILAESSSRFTSFGETRDGELRLLTFDRPSILKLTPSPQDETRVEFPTKLSQTGCFSDTASGQLAPSVIPYYLNIPFWSDEAEKERAFALPAGSQMVFSEINTGLDVPLGTVLVKTFYLTSLEGERRRVETRLMHHSDRGWIGYSYRWDDDQRDATLVASPGDINYNGPRGEQAWEFLNQSACNQCHTAASNRTLGLELQQLNRRVSLNEGWYEQLTAFAESGYLQLPAELDQLESFRDLSADPSARAEQSSDLSEPQIQSDADYQARINRDARAYLQVNCSSCHRPNGSPTVELDLRAHIPLSETGLCDGEPLHGDLNIEGARHLIPGDPERSLIVLRTRRRGEDQMPPMGTHLVDFSGVGLLSLWVSQLDQCE